MDRDPASPATLPGLSIIIPASNEAGEIGGCLSAVLESDWHDARGLETIVAANGCRDATAEVARGYSRDFQARGWTLRVIEIPEGGKLNALNVADKAAQGTLRAYLDADVRVSPGLLLQLAHELDVAEPRYASGRCEIALPRTWTSRAYRRIYRQVPFMTHGVPGCGLFAVNAAGRARWGRFPDIISDDTFVRLSFAPQERRGVAAPYQWPIVEGWGNLVRVRRRQDRGVQEIARKFPKLLANDDKPPFPASRKLAMALKDPIGFAVYSGVALAVRVTPDSAPDWSRGR